MVKYGIVTDLHGTSPARIEDMLISLGVDKIICMGDFDRTHVALGVRDAQRSERVPWLVVPGNHDHAHVSGVEITSGTMRRQGIDSQSMFREWASDPEATEYIRAMLENRDAQKGNGFAARKVTFNLEGLSSTANENTVAIHGAYAGEYNGEPVDLWTRLPDKASHSKNFAQMEQNGHRLMLRGHDHSPEYAYKDSQKGVVIYAAQDSYRLFPQRMHTITPGSAHDGNFAIIDTHPSEENVPIVTLAKDSRIAFNSSDIRRA